MVEVKPFIKVVHQGVGTFRKAPGEVRKGIQSASDVIRLVNRSPGEIKQKPIDTIDLSAESGNPEESFAELFKDPQKMGQFSENATDGDWVDRLKRAAEANPNEKAQRRQKLSEKMDRMGRIYDDLDETKYSNERQKIADAQTYLEVAYKYLTEGFEALNQNEQGILKDSLVEGLSRVQNAKIVNAVAQGSGEQIAVSLLANEEFKQAVGQQFDTLVGSEYVVRSDTVSDELEKTKIKKEELQNKLASNESKAREKQKELKEFKARGKQVTSKYEELQKLRGQKEADEKTVKIKKDLLAIKQNSLKNYSNVKNIDQLQLNTINDEIAVLSSEVSNAEWSISRLNSLESELAQIEESLETLNLERESTAQEKSVVDRDVNRLERRYEGIAQLEQQEVLDFAVDVTQIVEGGTHKWLGKSAERHKQIYEQQRGKKNAEVQQKRAEFIHLVVERRYKKEEVVRDGSEKIIKINPVFDKKQMDKDFQEILDKGSEDFLYASNFSLNQEEQSLWNQMVDDSADNAELKRKVEQQLVQEVLLNKHLNGTGFNKRERQPLLQREWGREFIKNQLQTEVGGKFAKRAGVTADPDKNPQEFNKQLQEAIEDEREIQNGQTFFSLLMGIGAASMMLGRFAQDDERAA